MISSAFVGGQFDIEDVDIGEAFEQDALAFHDGLAGGRADVAESQDGGAVGDHGHQVAFGRCICKPGSGSRAISRQGTATPGV